MRAGLALVVIWFCGAVALGQEHRVELLEAPPPADAIPEVIAKTLAPQGLKVIRGSSRTVCEIWPCKSLQVGTDFKPTVERIYPFRAGQLIGVMHYTRRGKDFRDQSVSRGWYTLRFGLQPIDGNHEGTSPTRDFLLLVKAEDEKSPEPVAIESLLAASAEAAGSTHPAMLCLQRAAKEIKESPSMRHIEEKDWWVLRFTAKAAAKEQTTEIPVDLIVAGHADE